MIFKRIKGDDWPDIELLIRIPSTNLKDGTHKLDDIVIRSSNGDVQLLPGVKFEIQTMKLVKPPKSTTLPKQSLKEDR